MDREDYRAVAWIAAAIVWIVGDVESTYYGMRHGAREGNPLMRPFVNRGRSWVYGLKAAVFGFSYWRSGGRTDAALSFLSFGAVYTTHNVLYATLLRWTDREMTPDPEPAEAEE